MMTFFFIRLMEINTLKISLLNEKSDPEKKESPLNTDIFQVTI